MNPTTTNDCSATEVSVVLPQDDFTRCQFAYLWSLVSGLRSLLSAFDFQLSTVNRFARNYAMASSVLG